MSGLARRMKRAVDKKQHRTMSESWKVAKAIQKKKLDEAAAEGRQMTNDELARYVPNGRLLGRKPTFREFVDLKIQALAEAAEKSVENEEVIEDLSWDDERQ